MTAFTDLIQGLSKELGYEIDVIDNACAVGTEDVSILLMGVANDQEDFLAMTSQIGTPPPQRLEKLYEEMMNAMFSYETTGGCAFARNPNDGTIWIQRVEPIANITPEGLISRITKLTDSAAFWRTLIEDFREVSADAEQEVSSEVSSGFGNGFIQV